MLRQPIDERLAPARSILLAGAGGGYDVLGAVPLLHDLREAGKTVHLASLTFTDYASLSVRPHEGLPNLAATNGSEAVEDRYCPELWLARWLSSDLGVSAPVWLLEKTGVRPLRRAYETLVSELSLDAIVLIDGGIDVVLKGNETSIGTPGEDLSSLAAVSRLGGLPSYVACLGMTAELATGISHAQFLRRVAELTQVGAFLGASGLSALTPAGQAYLRALDFVTAHQGSVRTSHVQGSVREAMRGAFGAKGELTWLSPLLPMYWFFDASVVASTHLFLPLIEDTESAWDVSAIVDAARKGVAIQDPETLPI